MRESKSKNWNKILHECEVRAVTVDEITHCYHPDAGIYNFCGEELCPKLNNEEADTHD